MDHEAFLTEEQRSNIENDERTRIAEERYRADVRARLTGSSSAAPPRKNQIFWVLAALGLLASGAFTATSFRNTKPVQVQTSQAPVNVSVEEDISKPSPLPPVPAKLTTAEIADRAAAFVVVVQSFGDDGENIGQGSGYIYAEKGPVITNYHVVRGASRLVVKTRSGLEFSTQALLGYDTKADLAALDVPSVQIPVKPLAAASKPDPPASTLDTDSASEASVGDRVVAIGAPLGLESTVSEGIVSAIRDFGAMHVIQTTASISHGSSGGPLLNEYGKVIGITTATLQNGQNLNLAISSRHVAALISQHRSMSLSSMLTETLVSDSVGQTTVYVPARQVATLQFVVAQQQGATLEGSYSISGGMGHDAGVWILGPNNTMIVNSGRVSEYGQVKQKLAPGQYSIIFDNRFSMVSSKSISPSLRLVYYR